MLILMSILLIILTGIISYLYGRHYAVVSWRKLHKLPSYTSPGDIVSDIEETMAEFKPPRTRIISPSKNKAHSLVDMEKDTI